MAPRPMSVAFILCDQVIRDSASGKWSAIGIFDRILCAGPFPSVQPHIGVYFRITDAEGDYPITIDVGRLTDEGYEVVTRTDNVRIKVKDRMVQADFGINLQGVTFPEPGRYQMRLLANGELIGEWPLNVSLKGTPVT